MGADFILHSIPTFDPTEDRRTAFSEAVKAMTEQEINSFMDEVCPWEGETHQDVLMNAFDEICHTSRHVCSYRHGNDNHETTFTGGLSWGDNPTDDCQWMSTLCAVPPSIWAMFEKWAIEDWTTYTAKEVK